MRLILRNILWILGSGLIVSAIVFLVTLNQPGVYTSSTVLYTGFAAGNPLETGGNRYLASYNEKAKFANLIHLIKSREVQEETALWLMAQHLMLREPDPRICLPETWRALMEQAPDEVRELVATPLPVIADTGSFQIVEKVDKVDKVEIVEKTEIVPVYYIVKAGDFPSAIAESHGITPEQLERLNPGNLDPIVGGQRLIVGYEQKKAVVATQDSLPVQASTDSAAPVVDTLSLLERTVVNLTDYMEEDRENFVYQALRSDHPYYSIQKLSSISVKRLKNSDLVKLTFSSADPAVSMNTLMLTTQVFLKHYREIASPPQTLFRAPTGNSQSGHEIRIIDGPVVPSEADTTQRMIYLILAFASGVLAVILLILIIGSRDHSIKYPGRFSKVLGVNLIGGFPQLPSRPDRRSAAEKISERCIDQITQKIRLEDIEQNKDENPFLLFILSTRDKTGKTTVGSRIVEKLRHCGLRVLALKPIETTPPVPSLTADTEVWKSWDFEYDIPVNLLNVKNLNDLMRNYTFLTKGYQYIVVELPPLLTKEFPALLVKSGSLSIVVGNASGTWKKADSEMLKLYASTADHPIMALLNGCKPENLGLDE